MRVAQKDLVLIAMFADCCVSRLCRLPYTSGLPRIREAGLRGFLSDPRQVFLIVVNHFRMLFDGLIVDFMDGWRSGFSPKCSSQAPAHSMGSCANLLPSGSLAQYSSATRK